MLQHYLRCAWRTIRRNPFYSLVNIGCLSIGIAVTMTILLYLLHEHSYDGWHANAPRIFAVSTTETFGSSRFDNPHLSCVTGPSAKQADPAVEAFVRMFPLLAGTSVQNAADPAARFWEHKDFYFADSNFFRFFSFRLIKGRPEDVLARPYTVVLTQSEAKKYFGTSDPVGKVLVLDGKHRLEVTGVAADVPSNSSIRFGLIASLATMAKIDEFKVYLEEQRLQMGSFRTWLLLKETSDTARVAQNLGHIAREADAKATEKNQLAGGFIESHRFQLQPIADTHLKGVLGPSNSKYLRPFTWVAAVILLLALVNYMSMATARAATRAKEVGVRKVIGAGRGPIAAQFYTESGFFAVVSFLLGGLLFLAAKPYFFNLLRVPIDNRFLLSPRVLSFFGGLLVAIVLAAGSYPSLVLSRFQPAAVLYGKLSRQRGAERMRMGFIVLQFAISMTLVICSVVIGKQLYYIRHMDTGVDRENVLMLPFGATMEHFSAYKQEVAALPSVRQLATTEFKLYDGGVLLHLVHLPGRSKPADLSGLVADSSFISLLGLKWKEAPATGSRWFGKDRILLNEAAERDFRLGDGAVGKPLNVDDSMLTIAGVLKDFNYWSLRSTIKPFGLTIVTNAGDEWPTGISGCLYARIGPHVNLPGVIDAIRKIYSRYDSHTPFEFEFLDDAFDSNYKQEDRLAGLLSVFTVVTIVIACLGLFALATFSARQRIREIGIRKVLGASVGSIGALLSRDFLRPVLVAVLIACPLSWWVMSRWLEDFAYRTRLSWSVFALSGFGLLGVALVTVLTRSMKAGRANPVDNLRTD
ncbi:MAG TPA: FtsX-like permease family protein [Puia sp.]|nr:FtsX-like permease family protein [Puia sp.]